MGMTPVRSDQKRDGEGDNLKKKKKKTLVKIITRVVIINHELKRWHLLS